MGTTSKWQTDRAVPKGTLLDPRAVPSWGLRVLRADFMDPWILAKPLLCGPDSPCQTPCSVRMVAALFTSDSQHQLRMGAKYINECATEPMNLGT